MKKLIMSFVLVIAIGSIAIAEGVQWELRKEKTIYSLINQDKGQIISADHSQLGNNRVFVLTYIKAETAMFRCLEQIYIPNGKTAEFGACYELVNPEK